MSVNAISPYIVPMPMQTPAYAPNGQLYPVTNSGKIIGGTIGALGGLATSGNSGVFQTAVNTATMTAIGVGVGAAVDYMINQQREQVANKMDYQA